jgi:outer membrane protein insertion porin family
VLNLNITIVKTKLDFLSIYSSIIRVFYFFFVLIFFVCGCTSQVKKDEVVRVAQVNFKGNRFVPDQKLKEVLPVKEGDLYIEQFAREGPERIVTYYRSRGFFNMRVIKREGEFVEEKNGFKVTYHIFEGLQSKIDSIKIIGNELFSVNDIRKQLSVEEGMFYDEAVLDAGKYVLANKYAEEGYADASILTERIFLNGDGKKGSIFLKITIDEGKKMKVGDVKIKGLKSVRFSVARRELRIEKGDVYRPSKIYLSQSNLYRTEMFSNVKVHEEKIRDDLVNITFILTEEKSRFFQTGFGYESPRKAIFDFKWGDLDLFGNLQRLIVDLAFKGAPRIGSDVNGLVFEDWEQNYRVTYREPYLLGTGFNLILSPALERKEFESDLSMEFVLEREFGPYSTFSFPIIEFRRASIQPDTINITNRVSARFLFDKRRNILNPYRGLRLLLQYDYAGRALGGDNDFDRLSLDIASYYLLPFHLIVAQRSRAVVTFPTYSPEDISPDVRLEMGGYGSLRGYKEASIGFPDIRPDRMSGLNELLFNFELRIPVYGRLYAIIFADFGSLWMDLSEISLRDFNTGVGFGVGYSLPIGVVRLDYAKAMREVSTDDQGKIYLNFGHPF